LLQLDLGFLEDRLGQEVQLFHLYQKYQLFRKYLVFQKNLNYLVLRLGRLGQWLQ
jgi:hypothetical protein